MSATRMLSTAALLALMGTAASAADLTPMVTKAPVVQAPPALSGYIELYTGGASTKENFESFDDKRNGWLLGGSGRVNYWWAPNASIQFDAQAEGTSSKYSGYGYDGHESNHSYLIGGHASWRDQRGLVGVFGAAGDSTASAIDYSSSVRHGLIGAEGQLYFNALTLYGQVGYDSTMGSVNPDVDSVHAWFARGTARYFIDPNLKVEGTVLYANGSHDYSYGYGSADFDTWLWRAKTEYKFAASPFSVFGMYEGSRTKFDNAFFDNAALTSTDHRFKLGLKLNFGDSTLLATDRSGATLDIVSPLSAPSMMGPARSLAVD